MDQSNPLHFISFHFIAFPAKLTIMLRSIKYIVYHYHLIPSSVSAKIYVFIHIHKIFKYVYKKLWKSIEKEIDKKLLEKNLKPSPQSNSKHSCSSCAVNKPPNANNKVQQVKVQVNCLPLPRSCVPTTQFGSCDAPL